MKTFDELFDGVIKHEGYYANVEGDRGGETYMGIARNLHPDWKGWAIIDIYKKKVDGKIKWNTKFNNLELTSMVKDFYCQTFYKKYRIADIKNGSLQEIIFDWCVNSGRWGAKGVQRVLNHQSDIELKLDGIIGKNTLAAINKCDPQELFWEVKQARIKYYYTISKNGKNHIFLEGWLKRIGAIKFEYAEY
jgi:lysozyme family protein